MVTTHDVAVLVEESLRTHPDLDVVVADNLRDRHYYLSGETIYLNGALPATIAWEAMVAALCELTATTNVSACSEHHAEVIPFPAAHTRAG